MHVEGGYGENAAAGYLLAWLCGHICVLQWERMNVECAENALTLAFFSFSKSHLTESSSSRVADAVESEPKQSADWFMSGISFWYKVNEDFSHSLGFFLNFLLYEVITKSLLIWFWSECSCVHFSLVTDVAAPQVCRGALFPYYHCRVRTRLTYCTLHYFCVLIALIFTLPVILGH